MLTALLTELVVAVKVTERCIFYYDIDFGHTVVEFFVQSIIIIKILKKLKHCNE